MKKNHQTPYQLSMLGRALVGVFSMASAGSIWAVPNYWVGPGEITEDSAWSAGVMSSGGANVINSSSPAAAWNVTDQNSGFIASSGLYIGHAASGSLAITADSSASYISFWVGDTDDPDMPVLGPTDPNFRVGDLGGAGYLSMDVRAQPPYGGARMQTTSTSLGVGLGAGSSGVVDVLGAGKTPQQLGYTSPNALVFSSLQRNVLIGQDGGRGEVNIDGVGFDFATGELNYPGSSDPIRYFAVGDGAASNGSINILGNGKLASGNPMGSSNSQVGDLLPFSFIGKDAGTGSVTVQPTASGLANQADFYTGLAVGSNGGNGSLNVLGAGKALISNGNEYSSEGFCQASNPSQSPVAPASLQLSADGLSTGVARATGSGAELLVAGFHQIYGSPMVLHEESIGKVQIGSGGALITSNDATVKIGSAQILPAGETITYYQLSMIGGLGPVNVSGSGSVVYGSETAIAEPAGKIEASQINLTEPASQLKFNHTGSLTFNLPLTGNGKLVQQSGTTTISASVAELPVLDPAMWVFDTVAPCAPSVSTNHPLDQSGFSGGIDVSGGTLVLPASNVLPGLTATSISGGTLAQGGTNQNLGAVTQTGGVLQLTGGASAGAYDIANATTWAGGGGVVQLDTVLGLDGSPSDKLHVTGTISGTTLLQISNLNGAGAQTTGDGILVVQADSGNAANSFALASPLIVGGFLYKLQQTGNNWYLVSSPYVGPPARSLTPVPSLSLWGLLGLGGLLAAFSSRILRRRVVRR